MRKNVWIFLSFFILILSVTTVTLFLNQKRLNTNIDKIDGELCAIRMTELLREQIPLGTPYENTLTKLDQLGFPIISNTIIEEFEPTHYVGMRAIGLALADQCAATTFAGCGFNLYLRDNQLVEISYSTKCS